MTTTSAVFVPSVADQLPIVMNDPGSMIQKKTTTAANRTGSAPASNSRDDATRWNKLPELGAPEDGGGADAAEAAGAAAGGVSPDR